MAPPRTSCVDPTHVWDTTRHRCRTCREAQAKSRQPGVLMLVGTTIRSAAAIVAWHTKREREGSTGVSAETSKRLSHKTAHRQLTRPRALTCRRGHVRTAQTVGRLKPIRPGLRDRWECLTCKALRQGARPQWVEVNGARTSIRHADRFYLSELRRYRRQLRAAHPDAGGSATAFRLVQRRYAKFTSAQREKYKALGLSLPRHRSPRQEAA